MKSTAFSLFLLASLLFVAPASAGFLAEQVDEGIYFVSYQRAQFVRGTLIWDTEKKVQRRLEKKVNRFCLEQGYRYYRFPTIGEIARDDELRAVWELASGDEAQNTSDNVGGLFWGSLEHVHKSRRMLLLSTRPGEQWLTCHSDKVAVVPPRVAPASEPDVEVDGSSPEEDEVSSATPWAEDRQPGSGP